MPLRPPSREELRGLGEDLRLALSEAELEQFVELTAGQHEDYEAVRAYEPPRRLGGDEVRERSAGQRVTPGEDPHNAWVTRCTVRGAGDGDGSADDGTNDDGANDNGANDDGANDDGANDDGANDDGANDDGANDDDNGVDDDSGADKALAGWEVGVKDNICVAGVEMTCGSAVVEGYVPDVDATIVTRMLDAGATVVGKTNMDDMGMTTTGHSAFGPILHPDEPDRLAGGSSGGSAVAVATGEVDAALGTDQGGSIRIPAAYCGVVGLKPTYGLVPYTGSVGLEHLVDHPGPMAPDVASVARLLSVLAGGTDHDPRQSMVIPDEQYEEALDADVSGLSIGVLEEGFERPDGEAAVERRVREAIETLADAGAETEPVSVPMHADARSFHSVLAAEGLVASLMGEGLGHGMKGWYNRTWVDAFGKFRRAHGGEFPAALKRTLLQGAYTSERYHSRYYARAMNLVLELTDRYDELLEAHDLLAMPTVAALPPVHDPTADEFDRLRDDREASNTAAFNRTGHPAVSVPAGTAEGFPVGLQLVGARFDDSTVLNAAYALEQARSSS